MSTIRAIAQFVRPPAATRAYQDADGTVFDYGHRWGQNSPPEKSHSVTSSLDRYEPLRVVARARGWWLGEIVRIANEKEVEASALPITTSDVARVVELVAAGDLTDKLARQVIEGVISGEGGPDAVIAARGIKVVSDDSELMAAIERAIAAEPTAAEKVRNGILAAAAGALIGLVMKETKGQADAAKVRELLLAHLSQQSYRIRVARHVLVKTFKTYGIP